MRLLTFLIMIINLSSCAVVATETGWPNTFIPHIKSAYDKDKAILLYHFDLQAMNSEAYADWVAYLQDFKVSSEGQFYIKEIDYSVLSKLVANTKMMNDFSLFIKKGKPSYLYSDVILEPQVYQAVEHVYSDKKITKQDQAFMPDKVNLLIKK